MRLRFFMNSKSQSDWRFIFIEDYKGSLPSLAQGLHRVCTYWNIWDPFRATCKWRGHFLAGQRKAWLSDSEISMAVVQSSYNRRTRSFRWLCAGRSSHRQSRQMTWLRKTAKTFWETCWKTFWETFGQIRIDVRRCIWDEFTLILIRENCELQRTLDFTSSNLYKVK